MPQASPADEFANLPVAPPAAGRPADAESTGRNLDASVPPAPLRELTAADLRSPSRRRVRLPLMLFVATCLSTFWVGSCGWMPFNHMASLDDAWRVIQQGWPQGLVYMVAVISILLMHEMGHYVQTLRYHVPASLPLFLPVPVVMTGTMGAVIGMDGARADRKQLFDIGITGPLAGLVVAVPLIWFGIRNAEPNPALFDERIGTPLIFKLIINWLRPHDLPVGALIRNPLFMAGWVGMLVTGLNMLPVSQLDGGHVIYGLFGKQSKWVARAFIIAAIAFIVISEQYSWVVMLVLVLMLGVDHPPTRDDNVPLGPVRWTLGLLSLLIPVFCFTPMIIPAGM